MDTTQTESAAQSVSARGESRDAATKTAQKTKAAGEAVGEKRAPGRPWSDGEVRQVLVAPADRSTLREIARRLRRTVDAIDLVRRIGATEYDAQPKKQREGKFWKQVTRVAAEISADLGELPPARAPSANLTVSAAVAPQVAQVESQVAQVESQVAQVESLTVADSGDAFLAPPLPPPPQLRDKGSAEAALVFETKTVQMETLAPIDFVSETVVVVASEVAPMAEIDRDPIESMASEAAAVLLLAPEGVPIAIPTETTQRQPLLELLAQAKVATEAQERVAVQVEDFAHVLDAIAPESTQKSPSVWVDPAEMIPHAAELPVPMVSAPASMRVENVQSAPAIQVADFHAGVCALSDGGDAAVSPFAFGVPSLNGMRVEPFHTEAELTESAVAPELLVAEGSGPSLSAQNADSAEIQPETGAVTPAQPAIAAQPLPIVEIDLGLQQSGTLWVAARVRREADGSTSLRRAGSLRLSNEQMNEIARRFKREVELRPGRVVMPGDADHVVAAAGDLPHNIEIVGRPRIVRS